ncbi:MAG: penicillin-binding protein 2 [Oscillospiraceae bacterium]
MKKRLVIIFGTLAVLLSVLYMRVAYIMTSPKYLSAEKNQGSYSISTKPNRAMIYDCYLNPLVNTKEKLMAAVMPCPENIPQLTSSSILDSKEDINALIKTGKPFLVGVNSSNISIPFVDIISEKVRTDETQLASHIVGYTDAQNNGVTGIEKSFNEYLNRQSSKTTISYQVDGVGRPLFGSNAQITLASQTQAGVVLTLDKKVQSICEEVGNKYIKKGAIVVMEPSTGKIRASCSFPSINVNRLSSQMKDNENKPLINRALLSYNVGSTFKIVTLAQALTQKIDTATSYCCKGSIDVCGQQFNCHKQSGHGTLNMKTALEMSCNPYYINLAGMLDKKSFLDMASDLSFGKPTVLAPSLISSAGYLPTLQQLYNPADVANFGFGQGVLMATPIQLSQMICAVVNNGSLYAPSLVEGFTENGLDIIDKQKQAAPLHALSSDVAATIKNYLISCVMDVYDQNAKPTLSTAGGKTATAQTGIFSGQKEIVRAWFCGFFPADNPKYVITVLNEDGDNGNASASPVFKEIVDKLY